MLGGCPTRHLLLPSASAGLSRLKKNFSGETSPINLSPANLEQLRKWKLPYNRAFVGCPCSRQIRSKSSVADVICVFHRFVLPKWAIQPCCAHMGLSSRSCEVFCLVVINGEQVIHIHLSRLVGPSVFLFNRQLLVSLFAASAVRSSLQAVHGQQRQVSRACAITVHTFSGYVTTTPCLMLFH